MTYKKGSKDPCKQEACDIQSCLKKNNYVEERCTDEIERLKDCCRKWFKKSSDRISSECCSGFAKELAREERRNQNLKPMKL